MTNQPRPLNPLHEIIQSQLQEIMTYKWLESEKAGRDIGWETANQEWTNTHFPAWKRHIWAEAVQDAHHTI
jgi:hypothetical protein